MRWTVKVAKRWLDSEEFHLQRVGEDSVKRRKPRRKKGKKDHKKGHRPSFDLSPKPPMIEEDPQTVHEKTDAKETYIAVPKKNTGWTCRKCDKPAGTVMFPKIVCRDCSTVMKHDFR